MQSKLPDINAAIVKYRSDVIICRAAKDYSAAISDLKNINALLPDEYQIEINSLKYNALIHTNLSALCNHCETVYTSKDQEGAMVADKRSTEIDKNRVIIQNKLLSLNSQMLSSLQFIRIWVCPECQKENRIEQTKWIQNTLQYPSYLKVIPNPPIRRDGLNSWRSYQNLIKSWISLFQEELERQIGLYRKDYVAQNGDEGNDSTQTLDIED